MPAVTLPEKNKRPGVRYVFTPDGVELPIVDVTHPAFALAVNGAEQRRLVETFLREGRSLQRLPKPLRNVLLRILLRGSILAKGIRKAQGTFMTGLDTYLLKLGPDMLGSAYAKPIDRRIAAALPALAVRLRLQDVAHLMADALAPALAAAAGRPLCFVNIAGGPAIDSLNALILLRKEHPEVLAGREVSIQVLDLDERGPEFGRAALAALSEAGGPLEGAQVDFRHLRYNWADAAVLATVLREAQGPAATVICSSEGGLFEYGSDEEILANLEVLRAGAGVLAVTGSVTRADEPIRQLHDTMAAATRPRGLARFRVLAERAGWNVSRVVERPFSDQVLLS